MLEKRLGDLNINDSFFDSFREDYFEFNKWFNNNKDRLCYVTYNEDKIVSLLVLKIENNVLKVSTMKVIDTGRGIGSRYIKIINDYKVENKLSNVYITVYEKYKDLVGFLIKNGFKKYGYKDTLDGSNKLQKELILWI